MRFVRRSRVSQGVGTGIALLGLVLAFLTYCEQRQASKPPKLTVEKTPTVTYTAFPAPGADVRTADRFVLGINDSLDVDKDKKDWPKSQPSQGDDISYNGESISSSTGAQFNRLGEGVIPTYRKCREAKNIATKINVIDLPTIPLICVITNEGHLALLSYRGVDSNSSLVLDITVWEPKPDLP
ncbi:hypothetical protein [Protofrankia coriariae]|uniref:hypothetical protein n=1 Tax=Protofrankia coriariae TaxID=1562887 RepID=UPI0012F703EB|nr:hypothetical protein [Protofrankia coriariae]